MGQKRTEMSTLRTHFTFRVDSWTPDGESISAEETPGLNHFNCALVPDVP
jgi:hypothetical protein